MSGYCPDWLIRQWSYLTGDIQDGNWSVLVGRLDPAVGVILVNLQYFLEHYLSITSVYCLSFLHHLYGKRSV